MSHSYEYRSIDMNIDDKDGSLYVEGKAICFDEPTVLFADRFGTEYREIISADALTGVDLSDVPLKYNHSSEKAAILARVRDGSLTLDLREDGLYFRAELRTNLGEDVHRAIKAGDVSKCSFAFICESDIVETNDNTVTRTITKIKHIGDISIVDEPAYEGTNVEARGVGVPEFIQRYEAEKERRKKLILLTLI